MEADQLRREGWPLNSIISPIYPRSFRDTTGSGEGDLVGVLEGLDHAASTGADPCPGGLSSSSRIGVFGKPAWRFGPGTTLMFQGEELGQRQVDLPLEAEERWFLARLWPPDEAR